MTRISNIFAGGMLISAFTMLLDQWSKWYIMQVLRVEEGEIHLLSFFKLVMVWNQGISFGMMSGNSGMWRWVLVALAAIITGILLVWLWRSVRLYDAVALGLVIGGAAGNVIDRFRFGAVADFFYFYHGELYWPAFNIADSAIFIGVVLLCWDSIVNPTPSTKNAGE